MTGRDEAKLLMIGKSKKPRCLKHVDVNTLPVIYGANHNAWMTSALFQEWINAWDAALAKDRRKILLLVDNCTTHRHINTVKKISAGILTAKHHITYPANGAGRHQKLENVFIEKS